MVKQSQVGLTYTELRAQAPKRDRAEFNREVVQALREGSIAIRDGRYVARTQA